MSKRTQLLHKLKHVYSHNTKLVLDVENKDIELIINALEKQVAIKPKDITPHYMDSKVYECPICKEMYQEDEVIKELYCGHIYHTQCIERWLQQEKKCPCCNTEICI